MESINIEITQAIDVWSLGCIFVDAMIWVAFGWKGLQKFRQDRLLATEQIEGFKDGNCFHDGTVRLEVVDDWLNYAVDEGPAEDYISSMLVSSVRQMLEAQPDLRPSARIMRHWTEEYISIASNERQSRQSSILTNTPTWKLSPERTEFPPKLTSSRMVDLPVRNIAHKLRRVKRQLSSRELPDE
jgi:hypothetical protein